MRPFAAAPLLLLVLAAPAPAQGERYELGQRLKAFERAWDEQPDAAARKRAAADLKNVTGQFFSLRLGEAGRTLDDARFALASDKPTDDERWATSLYAGVPRRVIDASTQTLDVTVHPFYPVKADRPANLTVKLTVGDGEAVVLAPKKFPAKASVKVPRLAKGKSADLKLSMEVILGEKTVCTRTVGVSLVADLGDTWPALAELRKTANETFDPKSLEAATVRDRCDQLADLARGTIPETDLPAVKLFSEARQMIDLGREKPYFTAASPGQFWLSVPTGEADRTPCRLFVPKGLDAKKPVPLVLALHGMGGSENLFFEGYGDGHIVKLCEKRGWLLVAPRLGLGFGLGSGPPLGDIVDKLADRYPIDPKRVFVVGHSMGAATAVDAVQKWPGKFAAAAMLGGGGRVRKAEAFATLPVFVGVGEKDFALATAKVLKAALADAKAANVTFKEYPGLEHLLVVREALPDVFDLFDTLSKR